MKSGAKMGMTPAAVLILGLAASAMANNTCVDPSNFTYSKKTWYFIYPGTSIAVPQSRHYYGYECGNGEQKVFEEFVSTSHNSNWTIPKVTRKVIADAVNQYSVGSVEPGGFEFWSSQYHVQAARNNNRVYETGKFIVEPVYPDIKAAFPFDGTQDDPEYIEYVKAAPLDNRCRAAVRIRYIGPTVVQGKPYFANVYVFPGKGDQDLYNKPLVVGDAFDPRNGRSAWTLYTKLQYRNLLSMGSDPATQPINTFETPRSEGHDIWLIDFAQGGGDIYINAGIQLRLLEWIQERTQGGIMVGGPSMSGVVSRLSLLYSLPQNNYPPRDRLSKVIGFMSIDSPHDGASISGDLQQVVYEAATDTKLNAITGFASFFSEGVNNSAQGSWDELRVPAAHQMLFDHYYPTEFPRISGASHDYFYRSIGEMGGMRKSFPNLAVAYSNFHHSYAGTLDATLKTGVGTMTINPQPGNPATLIFSRNLAAGGSGGGYWEMSPGSMGNWYVQMWKSKEAQYMFMKDYLNTGTGKREIFAGTFIPIHSALGLPRTFPNFSNPSQAEVAAASMFDKVYYMQRDQHAYPYYNPPTGPDGRNGIIMQDKRFEHIIFDPELMGHVMDGIRTIEKKHEGKKRAARLAPALSLLLE